MTYTHNEKEFKLIPRTRKVIDLTDRLESKNLNDLIFSSLRDVNIKVLAELIKAFAEYEDKKAVFSKIDDVYDFIDKWIEETGKGHKELFTEVAEVVNEMGFFKEKMTPEDLKKEIESPAINFDLQELMKNSAQKFVDQMAEEEFKGFRG